ncbi:hypothetical protein LPJ77_003573 [Coemansia sp. RSA 2523]|nr:hypothetical protein LPJ58_005690 [Coemansia sp. RSA 1591]KAJ1753205.1 hypothetical protein LPJ69_005689 [Coemansia sp. RSA 1752]KAJ1776237.1 hypothetical protein LPJ54_003206 [Coemansia sp. RSA 1824]KAJ1781210.1 hypothetical protein LPJ67_005585 [Coemansia sp. RSA 1938]KAJ1793691.1 hypothetical protein LPJ62_000012 [Coemansia sp. RSA 2167]KAJ1806519.1 hypothetical protein LPJ77_003573 [Coemansia sp. RSA 2523]KAJ2148061.1 hypothetical protein IW142_001214 [Coemansia sp. RSA 564]KAJ2154385
MNDLVESSHNGELLGKLRSVLERAIFDLNSASGADIRLEQFAEAFDPENPTIGRLMCAIVKETLTPRKPSEPASPAASLRGGVPIHGSFRGGHSPAVDGSGSWMGSLRRGRNAPASVDLDHVRNLMEAVEIVSPHMVGSDLGGSGSPIPEARSGWALPGQAAQSFSEQPGLASSFGVSTSDPNSHAVRHRRISAQTGQSPGIPIRPLRPRARGHIDPLEFAEYAVAHMRPSPRFTPMGHGYPLSSSVTNDSRASLPRSFRSSQPPLNLPRQHVLDEMHNAPVLGMSGRSSTEESANNHYKNQTKE